MNIRAWIRPVLLAAVALELAGFAVAAPPFTPPTPEELAMKEVPGYPGVAAVILFREEITKDDLHVVQHYDRVKILTEEGKKYANVELAYFSTSNVGTEYMGDDKTLGEVSGRTIHPDGTIIPFTGKPYKKVIEKVKGVREQALVFTLPDVEVGSIIEYRYNSRINDNIYEAPDWFIQGDLYLKAGHYQWFPTLRELVDDKERPITTISWYPILPEGVKIDHKVGPAPGPLGGTSQIYDVTVKDVPPIVQEDFMPPIRSYSYRVLFNFTSYKSVQEYWHEEGKDWSKRVDKFANPDGDLKQATEQIVAGATTPAEKTQKIYAAVMKLENTAYTRAHDEREDKAAGVSKISTVADVLKRGRGTPRQLTELFIGMERAAGLKAYAMEVPDRSIELFTPSWMSFQQFDAMIAIVNLDGKDAFFDPGERYMPYGHLAWEHTMVRGLRQVDAGTEFGDTHAEPYSSNRATRVANLKLAEDGEVNGKVELTFVGASAVAWRHRALRGDEESLRSALRRHLEAMLPKSMEVKVQSITNIDDYEKPLDVTYEVKGTMGTTTGKRLLIPLNVFESGASATFPHDKRELPVYFHYPYIDQDAVGITFKQGFQVEAAPDPAKFSIPTHATYDVKVNSTPTSFTLHRDMAQGDVIVPTARYAELRKFYTDLEGKDHETVVLKAQPGGTATPAASSNN